MAFLARERHSIPAGRPDGAAAEAARQQAAAARRRRYRRPFSPLTLRVLAVNVLALAILVGGLLYLGRYQDQLIQTDLEALKTEARIFAGALGEGAVRGEVDVTPELSPDLARPMVRRLVETTETRTRLFLPSGALIADSRRLLGPGGAIQIEELPPPPWRKSLGDRLVDLYDHLITVLPRRDHLPVYHEAAEQHAEQYKDVVKALAGETSASVWATTEGGLELTVAVPVQRYKRVLGAVLLSRGGTDIDKAVRQTRLEILRVFSVALAVTVLLSIYLASAIARPIRRLAMAAEAVRHGHRRQQAIPDFTRRRDEIGDLSGALRDMTGALWGRMDAIERFAADVAHEIKNPLSSLRSAVETIGRVRDPGQVQRLMAIIADDVQRLDRLISDISNASRLDSELSRAELETVDLGRMLHMLADIHETTREPGADTTSGAEVAPRVVLDLPAGANLAVPGLEGRLVQVFQNVMTNALSFSPPGGVVRLSATAAPEAVEVTVADDGPGIPDSKLEAIFDRFYTERPAGEKFGTHSGLGLSISKQIVEAHGGRIWACNRRDGAGAVCGAQFTIRLPRG